MTIVAAEQRTDGGAVAVACRFNLTTLQLLCIHEYSTTSWFIHRWNRSGERRVWRHRKILEIVLNVHTDKCIVIYQCIFLIHTLSSGDKVSNWELHIATYLIRTCRPDNKKRIWNNQINYDKKCKEVLIYVEGEIILVKTTGIVLKYNDKIRICGRSMKNRCYLIIIAATAKIQL